MLCVVMGPSGCGKSTIGVALAHALAAEFLEGDSLHSPSNIAKMAAGLPLDDADRAPWLAAIRGRLQAASATQPPQSLVVACSALKQIYRDTLDAGLSVTWVYPQCSPALLRQRLEHRQGHYMKANMLASQLRDLEEPTDAITVDGALPVDQIVAAVLAALAVRLPVRCATF